MNVATETVEWLITEHRSAFVIDGDRMLSFIAFISGISVSLQPAVTEAGKKRLVR